MAVFSFVLKDLVPLKLALKFLHRDQVTMMVELGLAGFLFISCLQREHSITGKGQVEYAPLILFRLISGEENALV